MVFSSLRNVHVPITSHQCPVLITVQQITITLPVSEDWHTKLSYILTNWDTVKSQPVLWLNRSTCVRYPQR